MKKLILTCLAVAFVLSSMRAQEDTASAQATTVKFGVTGGLLNNNTDIDLSIIGINLASIDAINETGIYIGVFADIDLNSGFHVQPELTYGSAGDLGFIFLPIMAKYYVADKFSIHAGPQINFSTNLKDIKDAIRDIEGVLGTNTNLDDVLKTTGIDLAFGVAYDISDQFFAQARYAFELSNRYDGPLNNSLEIKSRNLYIGVGYSF